VEWFLTNRANDLFGSCLANGRLFNAIALYFTCPSFSANGSENVSISLMGRRTKKSSIFAMLVSMYTVISFLYSSAGHN
jgi:hypothetical protein